MSVCLCPPVRAAHQYKLVSILYYCTRQGAPDQYKLVNALYCVVQVSGRIPYVLTSCCCCNSNWERIFASLRHAFHPFHLKLEHNMGESAKPRPPFPPPTLPQSLCPVLLLVIVIELLLLAGFVSSDIALGRQNIGQIFLFGFSCCNINWGPETKF